MNNVFLLALEFLLLDVARKVLEGAYDRGRYSFELGIYPCENPYAFGSLSHDMWFRGWADAARATNSGTEFLLPE